MPSNQKRFVVTYGVFGSIYKEAVGAAKVVNFNFTKRGQSISWRI